MGYRENRKILLMLVIMLSLVIGPETVLIPGAVSLNAAPLPADGVVVYQFHRRFRCDACHTLETAINQTIAEHFSKELESGKLVFEVIDLDADGNDRYSRTYDFFYNTVIMVKRKNGQQTRFKNLEEVWDLTDKEDVTIEFIRKHIAEYL